MTVVQAPLGAGSSSGWPGVWRYSPRMLLRIVLPLILLWASGLAGCNPGPLELAVANESDLEAVVEVLGPGGAEVGFREVVRPGNGFEVAVERPGPGGWAVTVDGRVVTDWMDWPSDNPVIDFTLIIQRDGSVDVQDT